MGSTGGGFGGDSVTDGGAVRVVLGEGLMRSFRVGAAWGGEDRGGA